MFLLRDAQRSDLRGLKRLAALLNSVNLPDNEDVLQGIIDKSIRSFNGKIRDPFAREYLFVLENVEREQIVGTSIVIAQHGTYDTPHIYYRVSEKEHYSATLDRHFRHKVLSIGYNYEGPTEVGGLIVEPESRSGPEKPGRQLSYVRFLFIAMHRKAFRDRVLAELLPPLLPDGRSLLWEACGKKFTGLGYEEADRLSRQNKEFIKELFPPSEIYATLFPERAQRVLGEVGLQTRGVQRMLERIGFRYVDRIDPFDGGPHFEADTDSLSLVQRFRTLRLAEEDLQSDGEDMLVGVARESSRNRFRAVRSLVRVDEKSAYLTKETKALLDIDAGARVSVVPFE